MLLPKQGGKKMSKSISDLYENLKKETGIHTDFKQDMTYSDYLHLNTVLSSQHRLSGHHDEMLFIVIHQVSELWMKLILHELHAAIKSISEGKLSNAFKMLARVSRIQTQIIQAWDVLSTLTPAEYLEFRDKLGKASGFQSYQYRLIEFALGYKSKHILEIYKNESVIYQALKDAYHAPSIYDVSIQALAKAGFPIHTSLINRDFSIIYSGDPSVKEAWEIVYTNVEKYWDLYELAEKLVDIEDWLQQWRFRHMKTVERIIGFKVGTGGSSGVNYLREVLDHRFFPELWDIRTTL